METALKAEHELERMVESQARERQEEEPWRGQAGEGDGISEESITWQELASILNDPYDLGDIDLGGMLDPEQEMTASTSQDSWVKYSVPA